MTTIQSRIPLHQGHIPTAQSYSIFENPGEEIGQIISCCSNLPINYRRKILASAFSASGLALPALFFVFGFLYFVFQIQIFVALGTAILLSVCVFWYVWSSGERPHFCTFVGKDGVAKFTCRNGNVDRVVKKQILRFREAHALATRMIRHSINGIYGGTIYVFSWYDKNEQPIFKLHAEAKDHAAASIDSEVPFLVAAENQWNKHILAQKLSEMDETGFATFASRDLYQELRLGPNWIEIETEDGCCRFGKQEVQTIEVEGGQLNITAFDDSGSEVAMTLNYDCIFNASCFMTLARKCLG